MWLSYWENKEGIDTMNDLVSVIVPIYNVENYLNKCIESIRNQSYKNLEIILVDDGSPDNCGVICEEYTKADSRIKVIHKSNGGLSDARNCGIEASTGEYLLFVDSDDFIHMDMIRILYEGLKAKNAKVSVCSYQCVEEDEIISYSENYSDTVQPILMTKEHLYDSKYYINKRVEFIVAWNKLYHRSLFEEVRYPKGKVHEDEFTTYKLLYYAKEVVYIDAPLYFYVQRKSSIMGQKIGEKRLLILDAISERMTFYRERGEKRLWALAFEAYRRSFLRYVGEVQRTKAFPKKRFHKYKKIYLNNIEKYIKLEKPSVVDRVKYFISGYFPFFYSALLDKNQ